MVAAAVRVESLLAFGRRLQPPAALKQSPWVLGVPVELHEQQTKTVRLEPVGDLLLLVVY
jgi:hypothetical protein